MNESPGIIQKRCESPTTLGDRTACTRGVVGYYMYRFEYIPLMTYCEAIKEMPRRDTCYDAMFDMIIDGDHPQDPREVCEKNNPSLCSNEYVRYLKKRE